MEFRGQRGVCVWKLPYGGEEERNTMEKWVVAAKRADFKAIAKEFGINQVTARIIRNRDIVGEEAIREYLYGGREDLHDPKLLNGTTEAALLLKDKIEQKKKIRIIGDYDIDGVNATYILYRGLQRLGAAVDYEIPDRMKDGYGLNINLIWLAYEEGTDTILTCDNGIVAEEQIALNGADNIRLVYPMEGNTSCASGAAMVRGCPHPDAAAAFLDFCMSSECQTARFEINRARGVNRTASFDGYPDAGSLGTVSVDWEQLAEQKDTILERWLSR